VVVRTLNRWRMNERDSQASLTVATPGLHTCRRESARVRMFWLDIDSHVWDDAGIKAKGSVSSI